MLKHTVCTYYVMYIMSIQYLAACSNESFIRGAEREHFTYITYFLLLIGIMMERVT